MEGEERLGWLGWNPLEIPPQRKRPLETHRNEDVKGVFSRIFSNLVKRVTSSNSFRITVVLRRSDGGLNFLNQ